MTVPGTASTTAVCTAIRLPKRTGPDGAEHTRADDWRGWVEGPRENSNGNEEEGKKRQGEQAASDEMTYLRRWQLHRDGVVLRWRHLSLTRSPSSDVQDDWQDVQWWYHGRALHPNLEHILVLRRRVLLIRNHIELTFDIRIIVMHKWTIEQLALAPCWFSAFLSHRDGMGWATGAGAADRLRGQWARGIRLGGVGVHCFLDCLQTTEPESNGFELPNRRAVMGIIVLQTPRTS
ncbi:hypothetical protein B0H13DRAFT_1874486 [Mycena leptocephala]|nr:hypothetical protein B0H13DRAFT_1874486 [Mycena leptocephala]